MAEKLESMASLPADGTAEGKGKGQKSPRSEAPASGKKKEKKKDKKGEKEKDAGAADQGQKQSQSEGQQKGQGQKSDTNEQMGTAKPQKTKAELKAERRAIQEKQRAAKEMKKTEAGAAGGVKEGGGTSAMKKDPMRVPDHLKADDEATQKKIAKKLVKQQIPQRTSAQRKVRLFNHLHQYEREVSLTQQLSFSSSGIHPAIIKLGIQYAEGIISGSNARCLALLATFKRVIMDYTTPPQKELSRDLETKIKPYISFLNQCRLLSVSMGNAIKYLKWNITHIPSQTSDTEAKKMLYECIDGYISEKIILAADAISGHVKTEKKITDDDVIVVFACSSVVRKVLLDAHNQGIQFRVIVVDGRPKLEGREMLRRLVRAGIKCSYVLMNAASYVMQEATKVFLGAHALLNNGCVMSRVGTSLIALIAKSYNVPVLVCCETYKFSERGQTDSFVFNELGDPDDLVFIGNKLPYLNDWRTHNSLTLLNLMYDVTPPEFVSLVITELGLIPCTSVPVVLRMKQEKLMKLDKQFYEESKIQY